MISWPNLVCDMRSGHQLTYEPSFCGLSTTQWSESMNKFFKDFVCSSTMVSEFVHHYKNALDAHYRKEKEKDMKIKTSQPILKTYYRMEAEAGQVYIRK